MLKLDKSKLIKDLGKRYKLVPYLDKAWETFDEPLGFNYQPKKGDLGWHPSSHCTPSVTELHMYADAQLALSIPEADDTPPSEPLRPATRKAFLVGHFWHQVLQYMMVEKLGWCEEEDIERRGIRAWDVPPSEPFHYVTGSADVCPCNAPNWTGLVDIKTMRAKDFNQEGLPQDTYGGDYSTAEKYEAQINIYMDLFGQNSAIILGVNKDSSEFKEFYFERNQDLIDVIYEKWKFVSDLLDHNVIPEEQDNELFVLPFKGPTG